MKNNPCNTAEHTQECFEEEYFIVARIQCNTEKGLLAECLLSILLRAVTLKGRWEYCIPITGNSSLLAVPSAFAIAVFSRTTWSLLFIWPVYFQVIPLFMATFGSFAYSNLYSFVKSRYVHHIHEFTFQWKILKVSMPWKAVLSYCDGLHLENLLLMFLLLPASVELADLALC